MKGEHELIEDARGRGLMIGVELVRDLKAKEPADKEAEEGVLGSFRRGLAIIYCWASILRIASLL